MDRYAACCVVVLVLGIPSRAAALDPDPLRSTVPSHINLVGMNSSSVASPAGNFAVTVRDLTGTPLSNTTVRVRLGACGQTIASSAQPGTPCTNQEITGVTNGVGVATFDIAGSTLHRQAAQSGKCAAVFADGSAGPIQIGSMTVAAFDEDGLAGVRATDLRYWMWDLLPTGPERSDFDGTNGVSAGDFLLWISEYFSTHSDWTAPRCDNVDPGNVAGPASGQLYLSASTTSGTGTCTGAGNPTPLVPDCASGNDSTRIVVSFRPTATISNIAGFEAELEMVGPANTSLLAFWRFEPGGCNSGAMSFRSNTGGMWGPADCPILFPCAPPAGSITGGISIECPYPGTTDDSRARIRVFGTQTPTGNPNSKCAPTALANTVYTLFGIDIDPSNARACANGCTNQNVAIQLKSARFDLISSSTFDPTMPAAPAALAGIQAAPGDVQLTSYLGDDSTVVFMNGVPAGYPASVSQDGPRTGTWLAAPEPNPSQGQRLIRYRLATEDNVSLLVHDVAGRTIGRIARDHEGAGEHVLRWDGRMMDGTSSPNGVYFLELRTSRESCRRTLITLR